MENLIFKDNNNFYFTDKGYAALIAVGLNESLLHDSKNTIKFCLDWTERRYHLAGIFCKSLTQKLLEEAWLKYYPNSRAVFVTNKGKQNFLTFFKLTVDEIIRD